MSFSIEIIVLVDDLVKLDNFNELMKVTAHLWSLSKSFSGHFNGLCMHKILIFYII